MNQARLQQHIAAFLAEAKREPQQVAADLRERQENAAYYQVFSRARMLAMTPDDVYEYLSRLWAMLIWGNKHYAVDQILANNGLESFRQQLAALVWGEADLAARWDAFRAAVKGMGPAMISEILCKTHPDQCLLWNRRAYAGLQYLEVEGLPRRDYQLTGKVYARLCGVGREIAATLGRAGVPEPSLLTLDYFIWAQLQVEENLSQMGRKAATAEPEAEPEPVGGEESKFIHNDIRDKLADIGRWLGFAAKIEQKVSEGSKVDTIWEATIGNLGRVIYVFEVQTKGSIDSLMVNLLKSLKNPAVQGVVAVSDRAQLERIRSHAKDARELADKLKYWDYEDILRVHEGLEFVNAQINQLHLVPEGF